MNRVFDLNDKNTAYFAKDELPLFDSCGRRTSCYFYKNSNGKPVCRALMDFYNAADKKNQCGSCPFYKTEVEFKKGWGGDFYDDEEELEEAI